MLVIDASVALSWFITRVNPNEAIVSQEALQRTILHEALVPALWLWETTNGLLLGERHGAFTDQQIAGFQADLDSLPVTLDQVSPRSTLRRTLTLARSYKLTAYDATYLELAERTSYPLATFDRKLAQAARAAGIPIFGDPS